MIAGKPIRYEVEISGNQVPEYQWKLNGKPINEASDGITLIRDGNKAILWIQSVQIKHAGVYSLTFKNPNDEDEASFTIKVLIINVKNVNCI